MASSNIRDVLTAFSPNLDFFAITTGDGRIKVWDTLKGQLQTEFSNILSGGESNLFATPEQTGHLSIDYTCLKWVSFERKKKRKLGTSLLVLGTGSGDVLALDVSAGQLKWKISDCHPGGVSAISFSSRGSCIYTCGADGMVCEVDSGGILLRKFKASTKAVSSMCVSSDGKIIATASAQMKIFNCENLKKIQKFTGHPGAVRCMTLSEVGKYVFSSSVGERYVAVWKVDGSKKQTASCVLAMEHPSIYLDCSYTDNDEAEGSGFCVLAISEVGVCYFWQCKDIEELRKTKPTKISLSVEEINVKMQKGTAAIFAAKIQRAAKSAPAHVFLAHGFLVKPSFEKIVVHHGEDLKLQFSRDGLLLPSSQSCRTLKQVELQTGATVLDRSNAEGAVLPVPRVLDHDDKTERDQSVRHDHNEDVAIGREDDIDMSEADTYACPMEERLKSMGIISKMDDSMAKSKRNSNFLKGIQLDAVLPPKKLRAATLSIPHSDVCKTLGVLIHMWQSRSCSGKYVVPWIYSILVHHGHHILSVEPENETICSLFKIAKSKGPSAQSLFQLFGRLQLVIAQIDKASESRTLPLQHDEQMADSEDEDVDEVLLGEEDNESETSGENDY